MGLEIGAEATNTGAGIEHEQITVAAQTQTGGVAADAERGRARRRDGALDAPEPQLHAKNPRRAEVSAGSADEHETPADNVAGTPVSARLSFMA